jgi:hypothetical protein
LEIFTEFHNELFPTEERNERREKENRIRDVVEVGIKKGRDAMKGIPSF